MTFKLHTGAVIRFKDGEKEQFVGMFIQKVQLVSCTF